MEQHQPRADEIERTRPEHVERVLEDVVLDYLEIRELEPRQVTGVDAVATTWPVGPTCSASHSAIEPRPAPTSRHRQPGWTNARRRRENGFVDLLEKI